MNLAKLLLSLSLSWSLFAMAFKTPAQSYALPTNSAGDRMLQRYFATETARLAGACLSDIRTKEDWESRREEYRRQLQEMLGLHPWPQRTDLKPVVAGKIEDAGIVVERLQFQSLPGLYVTANLYRPALVTAPLPTILYVCGHALVKTNGVSYGNKTAYQHHGEWFARHGYVCLLIDTLQLGEIEGIHHGTHREGMWWWNSRGYTPAGVEAWNSIRALDYLETRPEVDRAKIGMTGRSGGGSYTWTTAALDERVRVAAPVAGVTDLTNQVVDGCVEGHCDCMFFVNTYRWDFALNAALIAPRPLLIVNTDSDSIFPLDGVSRIHAKVKSVYGILGVPDRLGLVIAPGPHKDTQDLQVPVFRWFNQHLKGEDTPIADAAVKRFKPAELAVFKFGELPADQRNTRIHESFVPATAGLSGGWSAAREQLSRRVFGGWPDELESLAMRLEGDEKRAGVVWRQYSFSSQVGVDLPMIVGLPDAKERPERFRVQVLDEQDWSAWQAGGKGAFTRLIDDVRAGNLGLALLLPRGIGPTAWTTEPRKAIHIRRRFMLLGQTVDGMRVWDIRRGIHAAADALAAPGNVELAANRDMAVNALYAALFEERVGRLELEFMPPTHQAGPDYLNILKVLDLPQALVFARERGLLEP